MTINRPLTVQRVQQVISCTICTKAFLKVVFSPLFPTKFVGSVFEGGTRGSCARSYNITGAISDVRRMAGLSTWLHPKIIKVDIDEQAKLKTRI